MRSEGSSRQQPEPAVHRIVRAGTAIAGLLWLAAGFWAALVAIVASGDGYEVIWLAIAAVVMFAIGLLLVTTAAVVIHLLSVSLATSSSVAFGCALLFVAVGISPPEGLGNVASTFVVLMILCATISVGILKRHRIARIATTLTWQAAFVRLMALLAGLAWILAAIWSAIFVSIVSALGGFVLIDLIVIVFMVVTGIAMLVSAATGQADSGTRLTAASAIAALGLSVVSGVGYARVLSLERIGGGELLIGAAILGVAAIASMLALVIRPPTVGQAIASSSDL